jgi:L-fucose isomerase-like protein
MKEKLRLGLVLTASEALDSRKSKEDVNKIRKKIQDLDVELIDFVEPLLNRSISKKAGDFFHRNNVDLLLVMAGTWTYDNFIVDTMEFLNCPVVFWSPPDPLGTPFPRIGSLVGAIQNCGVLTKMGKKVKIILAEIDSVIGFEKLKSCVAITGTIQWLKFASVGIIGTRTPGMLDTAYHELELKNQVGPEVVHIGIGDLIKNIDEISAKEANTEVKNAIDRSRIRDIDEGTLIESMKIYLATRRLVDEYDLNAIAFKCWPDLKSNNICSPCYTLSRLSDEGIMSACEGDVTAAVSMLILYWITGNHVYLGDLLKINNTTNEALYFHCGAKSSYLAENKNEIEYRRHAESEGVWKPGLTVDFPLKPGRVTFSRIGEIRGKYRMVVYTGNAVNSDRFVRGNPAKIILDKNPEEIVEGLIANGSEHHQIAVHGNEADRLKIFCEFLNLSCIEL